MINIKDLMQMEKLSQRMSVFKDVNALRDYSRGCHLSTFRINKTLVNSWHCNRLFRGQIWMGSQ